MNIRDVFRLYMSSNEGDRLVASELLKCNRELLHDFLIIYGAVGTLSYSKGRQPLKEITGYDQDDLYVKVDPMNRDPQILLDIIEKLWNKT